MGLKIGRFIITIILLFLVGKLMDWSKVPEIFRGINYLWVIGSCAFLIVIRFAMALRWKYLLKAHGIEMSQIYLTKVMFVSTLTGWILPGGLGSDIMRGVDVITRYGNGQLISATIFFDRLIGIYGMILFATVGGLIAEGTGQLSGIALPLVIIHILMVVGWGVITKMRVWENFNSLYHYKIVKKLREKFQVFFTAATNKKILTTVFPKALLVSIFVNLLRCGTFYCLYRSLGVNANLLHLLIVIPLIFVAVLIPISIGGFGVREGILVLSFGTVGIDPEVSASVGVLSHLLQIAISIPVLLFWFLDRQKNASCNKLPLRYGN